MNIHEKYIKRCIDIAKNGQGFTAPNPMVGCVIIYNDMIIGEGFTSAYGGNHAEVNAIQNVSDKSLLKKATLYVTLEPCSHFGKTPPCSNLIIENDIPNVVIGCIDDNPEVSGYGIEQLKKAGCKVIVGVLEQDCKQHHKRFFTFHNKKRPYIILKWAETFDGFIAPKQKVKKEPVWITNKYSRQLAHKWRAEEQAILVGTNTVIDDNPSLTTRMVKGRHPIRIIIDRNNKLSKQYQVFDNTTETIVFSNKNIDFANPIAKQICRYLYTNNINSIIIEGGAKTLQTFIDENLWDEARIFTGNTNFNDGIQAPKFKGHLLEEKPLTGDILKIYVNH